MTQQEYNTVSVSTYRWVHPGHSWNMIHWTISPCPLCSLISALCFFPLSLLFFRSSMLTLLCVTESRSPVEYQSVLYCCLINRSALLTGSNPFAEDDPWSDEYEAGGASAVEDNLSIHHLRQQQQRIIQGMDTLAVVWLLIMSLSFSTYCSEFYCFA